MTGLSCAFCDIAAGRAPAVMVAQWQDVIAFRPLNPVVDGHTLVVPRVHVADASAAPRISGSTMVRASQLAAGMLQAGAAEGVNLITSVGAAATQTVFHLHIHVVPRRAGEALLLPWSTQFLGDVAAVELPRPFERTDKRVSWQGGTWEVHAWRQDGLITVTAGDEGIAFDAGYARAVGAALLAAPAHL